MSDGYCDVNFDDACDDCERVDLLRTSFVTARKPAVCRECRGPIVVGDQYHRASYRFEGSFHVDRTCHPCHEAAQEFDFSMLGGFFWEFMREEWDRGANVQGCINRLTTAKAKAHMRDQWSKWQERNAAQQRRLVELRKARNKGSLAKDSGGALPSAGS